MFYAVFMCSIFLVLRLKWDDDDDEMIYDDSTYFKVSYICRKSRRCPLVSVVKLELSNFQCLFLSQSSVLRVYLCYVVSPWVFKSTISNILLQIICLSSNKNIYFTLFSSLTVFLILLCLNRNIFGVLSSLFEYHPFKIFFFSFITKCFLLLYNEIILIVYRHFILTNWWWGSFVVLLHFILIFQLIWLVFLFCCYFYIIFFTFLL